MTRRHRHDGVTRRMLNGSIDTTLRARFLEVAKQRGMSTSEAMEFAVKQWVQRHEPKRKAYLVVGTGPTGLDIGVRVEDELLASEGEKGDQDG